MDKYVKLEDILKLLDSKMDKISDKLLSDEQLPFYEFTKHLKVFSVLYDLRKEIIEEFEYEKEKTTDFKHRC